MYTDKLNLRNVEEVIRVVTKRDISCPEMERSYDEIYAKSGDLVNMEYLEWVMMYKGKDGLKLMPGSVEDRVKIYREMASMVSEIIESNDEKDDINDMTISLGKLPLDNLFNVRIYLICSLLLYGNSNLKQEISKNEMCSLMRAYGRTMFYLCMNSDHKLHLFR